MNNDSKLRYAKGNLIDMALQGSFDVIVHGCNCQITMGSGIAKEIKDRYPDAYAVDLYMDQDFGASHRFHKLGNYSEATVYTDDTTFKIVNAYTQYDFLPRGVDHFNYASFAMILEKLAHFHHGKRFGFPYIGMGLAGGDSKRILTLLEDFAIKVNESGGTVTLVEFG
mgnify:CR=1 FL=1